LNYGFILSIIITSNKNIRTVTFFAAFIAIRFCSYWIKLKIGSKDKQKHRKRRKHREQL